MDVQIGLALYWWQRLITFGSSRIKVKMYKAISDQIFRKGIRKYKKCCMNIYLNIDLFTFNKYCMCKLLYMTVTHNQNKMYNKMFFSTNLNFLRHFEDFTDTQNSSKFNNANKVI